ncbi:DUF6541 family protein [Microbacterium abyssi]|uniref:DUF6541 family protein n=1 Tax=Microbacterium abyssi TaxID=2782166 RepID=UPI001E58A83D|nr:DUF6541 family protein [Microbacterium sp. A18JL241]
MTWISHVPALIAVFGLLIVPGLPVAFSVRARGVFRLGIAVVVSLAVIAAASLIAPVLGLGWSLVPVALVAVVVGIVALTLRAIGRDAGEEPVGTSSKWVWGAVVAALCGWTGIVALGIGAADHPNQLYDGLFHLNLIEFILQNSDASSLHMTMSTPGQATAFYPALWHALVSLIVPVSGSVVSATNIVTLGVVGLIWPVAVASLTSVVFPARPIAAAGATLASFGFSVFPLGFLNWGVLYPNLLGTVLVPLFVAIVVAALRPALTWSSRLLWCLVGIAAVGAMGFAHPSALLGGIALVVPFLVVRTWTAACRAGLVARVVILVLLCLGLVALAIVWIKANVTTNHWLPSETMAQAVGEVLLLSPVERTAGLLLGPLAAIGIWQVVRMKLWWVLASYVLSVGFYLASAWFPILSLRSLLVGVWYDDTTRVGALLAMWGLPLAGLGVAVVTSWLRARWENGARLPVIALATLIAFAAASHLIMLTSDVLQMRRVSFQFGDASRGLSADEAALFGKADAVLDEDSVVIGDPLTGAALLYAYTGHDVVFPHVAGRYGEDATFLARNLVDGDAAVCAAVDRMGVTHALDFGDRTFFESQSPRFTGLHDLNESPILTPVATVGEATLYEVSGCE